MESLIRVSQAHARLMFRNAVEEEDAVISIHLISRSISSLSIIGNCAPSLFFHIYDFT